MQQLDKAMVNGLNHKAVLNLILANTRQNPDDGDDPTLRVYRLDLHCATAVVRARLIPNTQWEYEIVSMEFIDG